MLAAPMRVTLVAPLVAPLRATQAGGAQVILTELARRLADGGEEVEVVAAPGSRVAGVRVHTVRGAPFPQAMVHGLDGAGAVATAERASPHGVDGPGPPPRPAEPQPSWPSLQAAAYL